ncbi:unnamed protein product, partial [Vitis vinifera]
MLCGGLLIGCLRHQAPTSQGYQRVFLCRYTESFDKAVREGVALSILFSFKDVQFPETIKSGGILMGSFHVVGVYKNGNHLISFQQQNENSTMWNHGPGSQTMSAVPANTYYSFQGQNQQPGGFRQGHQPSQHFGVLGYPNFHHSQAGISLEHQQQNPRDGSLSGSQGQACKQSQQIWIYRRVSKGTSEILELAFCKIFQTRAHLEYSHKSK